MSPLTLFIAKLIGLLFLVYALGIGEYLILQSPPLQGLQHDPLKGGFRMNHPLWARGQFARSCSALQGAHTATETQSGIEGGFLFPLCFRVRVIDHGDRVNRTGFRALAASGAGFVLNFGNKV